jgi:putative effector of murein hydrolase
MMKPTKGLFGEMMLARLPIKSKLARGALMGIGAHAAGTEKAHELGTEAGTVVGLVMVLVGLPNVLMVPVPPYFLQP